MLERECKNLQHNLLLYLDNKLVELPEIEGVCVLNIPYWGAGVQPWTMGSGKLIS